VIKSAAAAVTIALVVWTATAAVEPHGAAGQILQALQVLPDRLGELLVNC
jgi:hypothetical protein